MRIEHILGRAVSRTQLMGGYLLLSVVIGFLMVSLGAIGLWSAGAAVMEEEIAFGTIYGAAIAYLPATLVMIGVSSFLIGCFPKATFFVWIYLLYSFFALYLGDILQLPKWARELSPFGHVAQAPIEKVIFMPLFTLSLIAAALMVIGLIGFSKRYVVT
ncbi:hypothetical protein [Texcoconibacillus texcoconensis]|uniref:Putative exporter of polyketide antibiotics n=1 Tax=Texcoconibacillus texcoconensis TaxID=1095777 RepID=A0A840QL14_9BACI|nr:hypothetical protein [Texcoconibacillus texcoconensis]MBB5171941.1 putative exporter of polyketide antibiotics [Texcoconibacillus texcoconensis]